MLHHFSVMGQWLTIYALRSTIFLEKFDYLLVKLCVSFEIVNCFYGQTDFVDHERHDKMITYVGCL